MAGSASISVLTSVNAAAQAVLPNGVRARGLEIHVIMSSAR